jgi:hypothetical protein
MANVDRFQEELEYWKTTRLHPSGSHVMEGPLPTWMARQRAVDAYRKWNRLKLVPAESLEASVISETEVIRLPSNDSCEPTRLVRVAEQVSVTAPEISAEDRLTFNLLVKTLLKKAKEFSENSEKSIALIFANVRMAGLDHLLTEDLLSLASETLKDTYPEDRKGLSQATGFALREKGRYDRKFEKLQGELRGFAEEFRDAV